MLALDDHQQAWFVGVRNTFYRIAFISGQGLLVIVAGLLEENTGDIPYSWMITFLIIAGLFIFFIVYHLLILPYPKEDKTRTDINRKTLIRDFVNTFREFFSKKQIILIVAFILFYRFGEAQLV
jgi:PAT family beta-lactamase induction signal transducer AmpG